MGSDMGFKGLEIYHIGVVKYSVLLTVPKVVTYSFRPYSAAVLKLVSDMPGLVDGGLASNAGENSMLSLTVDILMSGSATRWRENL